jgi:hypothetical protein
MNSQGTWVMDRTDATCPHGCRMWWARARGQPSHLGGGQLVEYFSRSPVRAL